MPVEKNYTGVALSESEALCRLKAVAVDKNYEVEYFYKYSSMANSLVSIRCITHNTHFTCTGAYLMRGSATCKACTKQRKSNRRLSDEKHIENFMITGAYKVGSVFERLVDSKNTWNFTCPSCSVDHYTKAGLCSGVFKVGYSTLFSGGLPCRCNTGFRWTPEQREYQILETFQNEKLDYKFLGWVGEARSGKKAQISLHCNHHGQFDPFLDTYLNGGTRCPGCATSGFNPERSSFIYVIRTDSFTGYGITSDIVYRVKTHERFIKRSGGVILQQESFELSGHDALLLEKTLKQTFPLFKNNIPGFKTEATDKEHFEDVLSFCKTWLRDFTT